ncbi:MAG: hypothetical protein IJ764_03000 [Bacteroidales bacterium]|nr:hypothetical protein [Bacteroidales bacterium]
MKALYYDVYHPRWAHFDAETFARFQKGRDFENTYKATFPQGIALNQLLGHQMDLYPGKTAELLSQSDEVVLFEAGFLYDDVLVLADVVHKSSEGNLSVFEVKNSRMAKKVFLSDIAIQCYVIENSLAVLRTYGHALHLSSFSLVYNDGSGGFVVEDYLPDATAAMSDVARQVGCFRNLLYAPEPSVRMGVQCDSPYPCPYKLHCQSCETFQSSSLPLFEQ